jgi:acetyltransferase-like isoleucine patch superfamily enzyme
LRATTWSWRGASIGRRVAIGRECRIERPWAVSIGDRAKLEQGVWLKVVDDEARVVIGASTFIGAGSELDTMESVVIGDHVLIAPGCFITIRTGLPSIGASTSSPAP